MNTKDRDTAQLVERVWTSENDEFGPDMDVDTCPCCDGDGDPIDDCFYCGTCQGRGWVYEQHYESPYLSMGQIEEWDKEWKHFNGKR